jgi:hypothetical protein
LQLTKSNIDALHQEIPVDSLCKTFQDAIIVTQALGLGYLWIDSLCIIQDDEHDWDQESATMADVYGNAVVNIAATNAIDGSAGLFVERSIHHNGPLFRKQMLGSHATFTPCVGIPRALFGKANHTFHYRTDILRVSIPYRLRIIPRGPRHICQECFSDKR